MCSVRKGFLRNHSKTAAPAAAGLILKRRLWHRCLPLNFSKFLRTPFFIEHLRWLLLDICISCQFLFTGRILCQSCLLNMIQLAVWKNDTAFRWFDSNHMTKNPKNTASDELIICLEIYNVKSKEIWNLNFQLVSLR